MQDLHRCFIEVLGKEAEAHIETLEQHVARLDGIIQIILDEIEAGTILESAARVREALQQRD